MSKLPWIACALFVNVANYAGATDHNEPELLSGFYSDRSGSGGDVYGLFGYPTENGESLNIILTLAPVPSTGIFDKNSVHRVFLMPGNIVKIAAREAIEALAKSDSQESLFQKALDLNPFVGTAFKAVTSYERFLVDPVANATGLLRRLAGHDNEIPIDQKEIPEIRSNYSVDGKWARIEFRNFVAPSGGTSKTYDFYILARSNESETDPNKLKTYEKEGVKVYAGGRDDPFFSDIAGFFRSISFAAALDPKKDHDFTWTGDISYKATPEAKELNGRRKQLINRQKKEGVYNAYDWRIGNNVNALVFQIPISRLLTDPSNQKVVYTWAEGFLTEEEYAKITR